VEESNGQNENPVPLKKQHRKEVRGWKVDCPGVLQDYPLEEHCLDQK